MLKEREYIHIKYYMDILMGTYRDENKNISLTGWSYIEVWFYDL